MCVCVGVCMHDHATKNEKFKKKEKKLNKDKLRWIQDAKTFNAPDFCFFASIYLEYRVSSVKEKSCYLTTFFSFFQN